MTPDATHTLPRPAGQSNTPAEPQFQQQIHDDTVNSSTTIVSDTHFDPERHWIDFDGGEQEHPAPNQFHSATISEAQDVSQFSPGPALPVPYPGGLVISTQIQTPANIPGLVMSLPIAPTDELPEALNTSHYGNELPTDEELDIVIVQQPFHARTCGFGEKDRRPIDPPPSVQLVRKLPSGECHIINGREFPFLVCHCSIWSVDEEKPLTFVKNTQASASQLTSDAPGSLYRVLLGALVSPAVNLLNPRGIEGVFFNFGDLSVRTEGVYKLKFELIHLSGLNKTPDPKDIEGAKEPFGNVIATRFSNSFMVYNSKKFPGMMESSELSKTFARQGVRIPIRNEVRSKRCKDEEGGGDTTPDEA